MSLNKRLIKAGGKPTPTEFSIGSRLYTGNGTSQNIDYGFEPDWLWIKQWSGSPTNTHAITDAVAGYNSQLTSVSNANETTKTNVVTGTSSSGITIGSDATVNQSGNVYTSVALGTTNETVINTDGEVATSVRALPGISIMEYQTQTTLNRNLGHGMGRQAKCVIFKRYQGGGAGLQDWYVWIPFYQANSYLKLNTTDAVVQNATWFPQAPYNDQFFMVGQTYTTSGFNVRYKALCLGDEEGRVKVSTYTGNGSYQAVPFGFQAKMWLIKRIDAAANWVLVPEARDSSIYMYRGLYPNLDNNYYQTASKRIYLRSDHGELPGGYADAEVNAYGGTYLSIAIG